MIREARMGSFNKRLHYVLILLLVCSAALTFFLLIFSLDTRAKVSPFAKEGMVTQGVVLDKARSYKAGTTYHHVQVRFVDVDGVERTTWTQTHSLVYDRLSVRGPVRVTYLRSKPQTFYLLDDAPTLERATGFVYGAIGCGLIAVILSVIVLLLRRQIRESVSVANMQFRRYMSTQEL
jgi:hypothetical protein